MIKKVFLGLIVVAFGLISCSDDDDAPIIPEAGTISGGPFTFIVDGVGDFVSGIVLDNPDAAGTNSTWIITDDQGTILGLPPTLADVEGVNFDGAGPGVCLIWYLRYEDGLTGLEPDLNANNLQGSFDLSNSISVTRNNVEAGTISGGPFDFIVDDVTDNVTGITIDTSNAVGENSTWVITDDTGKILGLPPTLEAVEGVDFNGAGVGVCLIWYLRYQDGLVGLEPDMNANDLVGSFDLSNSITVNRRAPEAGTLSGGPFDFNIDDVTDNVSGIVLDSSNAVGDNSTWVITDDTGKILGLPPTLDAVEGVDFNGAGVGVCLIWYLRYQDGIQGLAVDQNANDLQGFFDLSNSITVNRRAPEAGTITGGPFNFTIDGTSDFVSGIELDSSNAVGDNSTWVITDDTGKILGLPPTLDAVEGVDFNGAGVGVCLIWYLR
ncbi:MAG: hypothetical protein QNJ57_07760, partial [Flavobacteriaceae bacterium]|nr:hypothetical protein [Flavobacteriaceae bacterium]